MQEPSTADFGTLHYGQQAACDIVLRNVGSVGLSAPPHEKHAAASVLDLPVAATRNAAANPVPDAGVVTRHDCVVNVVAPQVTASFQFMPLPGAMFGEPADKAFRPAPRWASISPEQVGVLGSSTHCS